MLARLNGFVSSCINERRIERSQRGLTVCIMHRGLIHCHYPNEQSSSFSPVFTLPASKCTLRAGELSPGLVASIQGIVSRRPGRASFVRDVKEVRTPENGREKARA